MQISLLTTSVGLLIFLSGCAYFPASQQGCASGVSEDEDYYYVLMQVPKKATNPPPGRGRDMATPTPQATGGKLFLVNESSKPIALENITLKPGASLDLSERSNRQAVQKILEQLRVTQYKKGDNTFWVVR